MISITEYTDFLREYFGEENPKQRLGQTFCNKYDVSDSDLFYEEDVVSAISKIATYVTF